MTTDPPFKTKRLRHSSPAKPRKSSSFKRARDVYPQKVTVCLALFLLSFLLTFLIGLWVAAPVKPPHDILVLELNPKALCPSVAQDANAKMDIRESLQRDSWYFVPTYTLLFVALGLAIFSSRSATWIYGLGIVLLTIFASGSDFLENHYLESCIDGNYLAASFARRWSLTKWQFLSFATVAAAPSFLARNDWTQKIGYVLAALSIPGLLLLVPLDFAYPIVHYLLFPLLGLGLVLTAVSFVNDFLNPSARSAHWR